MKKAKVFFTKEITSPSLLNMYKVLEKQLPGKVAVKVHSGEKGNQNYLHPKFLKELIDYVNGTVVECNTAYPGERDTTEKHQKLMTEHEWTKYFEVDIMDDEGPDLEIEIPKGIKIKKNYLGKNIKKYDSMLIISHFKGHPMGGYGGALKQLSIGCASSYGKRYIHCVGKNNGTYEDMFKVKQDEFLESMADSASSVHNLFSNNIVYINILCNMSVDCDCCANAAAPCMNDIGILSSTDPIALDQACIDLIYTSKDKGRDKLIKRIESRNGTYLIDVASKLNFGTKEYELINVEIEGD